MSKKTMHPFTWRTIYQVKIAACLHWKAASIVRLSDAMSSRSGELNQATHAVWFLDALLLLVATSRDFAKCAYILSCANGDFLLRIKRCQSNLGKLLLSDITLFSVWAMAVLQIALYANIYPSIQVFVVLSANKYLNGDYSMICKISSLIFDITFSLFGQWQFCK